MKHIVVLIAAIIAAGAAMSSGQVPIPAARGLPRRGLVAFWSAEGNARDSAGKNHGKLVGGATFAPGKIGQAFKLDGQDDCVEVAHAKALQITGDQTLAMWIKPARLGVRQNILHKAYGGEVSMVLEPTGELSYLYGSSGRDGEPYVLVTSFGQAEDAGIGAGQLKVYKATKTAVKAGQWAHIGVVRDMAAGRLRWYVNGKHIVETDITVPQAKASNAPFRIGAGYLEHFSGLIDEVGVWNRPLTDREIAAICAHASALSTVGKGLVGLWLGDGDAKDDLGKHDGKAAAAVAYTADRHGVARRAFRFDGADGHVTVPDSDALDTDAAFTISTWIKSKTNRGHLFVKWGGALADYSLEMTNGGRVMLIVCGTNRAEDKLITDAAVTVDRWTHVAATFDKGRMGLYIDGKLAAAKTSATVKSTCTKEYDGDDVGIGGHDGGTTFGGATDEPALWNRALSAEEIAQVARAASLTGLLWAIAPHVVRDTLGDRIVLNDGNVLKGAICNEMYELTTFFGKVRVPASNVIGLAPTGSRLWLMLADGQALVGEPGETAVTLRLAAGSVLKVPLARIRQCGYRITGARPAEPEALAPMVTLRSGQGLALAAGAAPTLRLRTPYATVALSPGGLVRVEPAPGAGGSHRAVLTGGSVLTGTLASRTLKFPLALGPLATVRREEILRLTGVSKAAPPADAAVMTMRNGDRLVGALGHKVLTVRTEFGPAKVFPISVLTATFNAANAGAVVMTMWNGSTIEGQLVEPALTFIAAGGPAVKVAPAHVASITRPYALPGPETAKKVAKLIACLAAESYKDREAATKELVKMGKGVVPLLKKHRNNPDAEVHQRIEGILGQIDPKKAAPLPPPNVNERNGRFIFHD